MGKTGRWGQHLGRPPCRLSAAPARQPRRLEPDPRPAARLADDKSELEGSTLSVLSAASSASRRLPPQEQLREKAFEYCQRLIEQSNRRESPGAAPLPQGRASAARRRPGPRSCFSPEGFSFSGLSPWGLSTGQKPSLGSGGLCPPASVPSPVLPGGSSLPSPPPPPPVAGLPPPSGASRAQRAVSSCCPDAGAETGDSLSSPRSPEEGRRRPAEGRKCRAGRRGRRAARGSPAPPERGLCARSAWWRPCWCWTCSAGRTPPSCTAPSPA